ncbi:MAG: ACP S-malonyltransferase [Trueperaceae bacterium]|nr:ACP S-malonyltransferase [Trueperaceae bacterium]
MANDLYHGSRAARRVLDEAEGALPGLLAQMWEGPAEELQRTSNQQPALVAAGAAAYAAWLEAGGPEARFAAGHSLGEFTALVAAGSLRLADAVRIVRARGDAMQSAVPEGIGAMAAVVRIDGDRVARACAETDGVVEVANRNAPQQTVISGEAEAVARASARLALEGARAIPLKVSAPFHCSLMRPAAEALAPLLRDVALAEPAFAVVCNVTADVLPDAHAARDLLVRQVTAPVRWVETLERLRTLGATRYVEFGSGTVLAGLVARTLPGADVASVHDMASLHGARAPRSA